MSSMHILLYEPTDIEHTGQECFHGFL